MTTRGGPTAPLWTTSRVRLAMGRVRRLRCSLARRSPVKARHLCRIRSPLSRPPRRREPAPDSGKSPGNRGFFYGPIGDSSGSGTLWVRDGDRSLAAPVGGHDHQQRPAEDEVLIGIFDAVECDSGAVRGGLGTGVRIAEDLSVVRTCWCDRPVRPTRLVVDLLAVRRPDGSCVFYAAAPCVSCRPLPSSRNSRISAPSSRGPPTTMPP